MTRPKKKSQQPKEVLRNPVPNFARPAKLPNFRSADDLGSAGASPPSVALTPKNLTKLSEQPLQTPLIVYLLAQTNFPLSRLIAKPKPFAIPAPST